MENKRAYQELKWMKVTILLCGAKSEETKKIRWSGYLEGDIWMSKIILNSLLLYFTD